MKAPTAAHGLQTGSAQQALAILQGLRSQIKATLTSQPPGEEQDLLDQLLAEHGRMLGELLPLLPGSAGQSALLEAELRQAMREVGELQEIWTTHLRLLGNDLRRIHELRRAFSAYAQEAAGTAAGAGEAGLVA